MPEIDPKVKAEKMQRHFYNHLLMHPSMHQAGQAVAARIVAKDPSTLGELKNLAEKAKTSENAKNTLRIIAVTLKYEHPQFTSSDAPMFAGGMALPNAKNLIKLALMPVSWVLGTGGKIFHWGGNQLQHFARFI